MLVKLPELYNRKTVGTEREKNRERERGKQTFQKLLCFFFTGWFFPDHIFIDHHLQIIR
jgi:hypothetical protein